MGQNLPQLEEIKHQVFIKRPILAEIAQRYSKLPLKEYVQKAWALPKGQPGSLFLSILKEESSRLYGQEVSEKILFQLNLKPLVSTIDHHGIWNHPFFVNSDLIFSLHFSASEIPVVLATESVSLNNSSWPSSINFHNQDFNLTRESFLAERYKTLPVFSAPSISKNDVERFSRVTQGRFDGMLNSFKELEALSFSSQASKISSKLWSQTFPSAPKVTFLPLETIILKYLEQMIEDKQSLFYKIIMTFQGRQLWQNAFSGESTFMFWGIDEEGKRQILRNLPEDPAELVALIKGRKVYPASPLCFAVLLWCGLSCVGGFNQTTRLTLAKEKFVRLFAELGFKDNSVSQIPTQNFGESSLACLKIGSAYKVPSGADLFLTGKDYYPSYLNFAQKLSLGQSLDLAMSSIYNVVVPAAERVSGFDQEQMEQSVFENLGIKKLAEQAGL